MEKNNLAKIERIDKWAFCGLIGLLGFLPFSSWIVSLTGKSSISLLRDLLVGLIFLMALYGVYLKKKKIDKSLWLFVIFILFGLLSVFWREDSLMQWLRGFRFTFMPIVLFLSVCLMDLTEKQKSWIYKVLIAGGVVISGLTILELAGVKIPLTTSLSSTGALVSEHITGSLKIPRLQGVLAGPNALGLYMMALVGCCLGIFQKFGKKSKWLLGIFFVVLVFTFCRSALIGTILMLFSALFVYLKDKLNLRIAIASLCLGLFLLAGLGLVVYSNALTKDFLTHYASSQDRLKEYQRIWDTRNEIGLVGRGMGTAGPASQYSLDGTANHWTENIYLDTFEQLGLIGALLFGAIFVILIRRSYQKFGTLAGRSALFLSLAFAVSGIFINIYTGQIGIFLLFLISGLMISKNNIA